jgi:hypothetical protein
MHQATAHSAQKSLYFQIFLKNNHIYYNQQNGITYVAMCDGSDDIPSGVSGLTCKIPNPK